MLLNWGQRARKKKQKMSLDVMTLVATTSRSMKHFSSLRIGLGVLAALSLNISNNLS